MQEPQIIPAHDLIDMSNQDNIQINLAYAHDVPPNIFGKIYRDDARLWLHKLLADIVVQAAEYAAVDGFSLLLYDGLRTTDAQAAMQESAIVKANPQWMEEPRLLSPPGKGAHCFGMAIDLTLVDGSGDILDMGTAFDFLAENSAPEHNPAHRSHPHLSDDVRANRARLDGYMVRASEARGTRLMLLAQEWWDFRLPRELYEGYAPLSDHDLPAHMRMT